jgi:hypothetical protein
MKIPITYLLLISLICCSAFSQEERGANFSSENERLNVVSNMEYGQLNFANSTTNQQNLIFIQQIGENNKVYSQTQSQNSRINLYQYGNSNNVNINANAPSIDAFVIQNGNNNYVQDNVYYSNVQVKLNAIQNGDNLTINRLGANSLSNKLQLVQEGSFKTITVISN